MQRHKSQRHVNAARARWRAAEERAQWERDSGIPDREPMTDARQPFTLDLSACGFRSLRIEPRIGYVAWRAVDVDTGDVLHSAALKELLHWIADALPRMLAMRNYQ